LSFCLSDLFSMLFVEETAYCCLNFGSCEMLGSHWSRPGLLDNLTLIVISFSLIVREFSFSLFPELGLCQLTLVIISPAFCMNLYSSHSSLSLLNRLCVDMLHLTWSISATQQDLLGSIQASRILIIILRTWLWLLLVVLHLRLLAITLVSHHSIWLSLQVDHLLVTIDLLMPSHHEWRRLL
jgi:hypothetical protein